METNEHLKLELEKISRVISVELRNPCESDRNEKISSGCSGCTKMIQDVPSHLQRSSKVTEPHLPCEPEISAESCWDLLRSAESWDIWRWSLESLEVWWSLGVADVAVYSKGTLWDSSHSCCFVGFSFWFSLDAYPHLLTKNMSMYTIRQMETIPCFDGNQPSGRSKTFCSRAISLNSIDLSKQARWRAVKTLAGQSLSTLTCPGTSKSC